MSARTYLAHPWLYAAAVILLAARATVQHWVRRAGR